MVTKTEQVDYSIEVEPLLKKVPEVFQLKYDELGREAAALVQERFRDPYVGHAEYYGLDSPTRIDRPITFGNIYRRYAFGDAVREITGWNVRPINPVESEIALREGTLPADKSKFYEVLGILLCDKKSKNTYHTNKLREHLLEQAKDRGLEVKLPAIVTSLSTIPDDSFEHGVRFDLGKFGEIYPITIPGNGYDAFDKDDQGLVRTGIPYSLGSGNRELKISVNHGLGWFFRGWDLDLLAVDGYTPSTYASDGSAIINLVRF